MRIKRSKHRLLILFLACLLVLIGGQQAFAHGANGKLQISRSAVGPYFVSVWSEPAILRTGDIRFEAFVVDGQATPDFDCAVEITLTPLDSERTPINLLTHAPTADIANLTHEINYHLTEAGRYRVAVSVVDGGGEVGVESFEIEVTAIPTWLKAAMNGFLLLMVGLVLSLLMKGVAIFGLWREAAPVQKRVARRSVN